MPVSQPDPSAKPSYGGAGTAALMIIGLLFLVPSGLCTGILGGGAVIDALTHPENIGDSASMIVTVAIVGGPFVAFGAVLVWFGVKRMRGR
jgi:hypothetical protein